MRNDERADPDGQQSCNRKAQSDLAEIPVERLLEIIIEEREIVVRNAKCDTKRYESGCNNPPAIKAHDHLETYRSRHRRQPWDRTSDRRRAVEDSRRYWHLHLEPPRRGIRSGCHRSNYVTVPARRSRFLPSLARFREGTFSPDSPACQ